MSLNQIVDNLLASPTSKRLGEQKFTFAEIEQLAERGDFSAILTAAGVPDRPVLERAPQKWRDGEEFDASKFHELECKKYQQDFFKR